MQEKLHAYVQLLQKWNRHINLVARADDAHIRQRHIADSLQVADYITADHIIDFGSGGGLPAIVLAITKPNAQVTMIESDSRKAVFLSEVIRGLELTNATAANERVEKCSVSTRGRVCFTSRAFTDLTANLRYIVDFAERSNIDDFYAMLMKGKQHQAEISQANAEFSCDIAKYTSTTDSNAAILRISNITARS